MSEIQRTEEFLRKRAEAFFDELESRFECDLPFLNRRDAEGVSFNQGENHGNQ